MSPYWSPLVQRLTPYIPGVQRSGTGIVKLNTNENPYPPSPRVLEAIRRIQGDALKKYPDPESTQLRDALARYHGVDSANVFVGNGSDEVLALAFMAFFTGDQPLAYPAISYAFYPVYCDLLSIDRRPVALTGNFVLELEHFDDAAGGIVFPNPNAPTGRAVDLAEIEALLERFHGGVILIDEAYADFGAQSAIGLITRYPNLLVTRSFSKGRALAGMRVGFACGDLQLIEALQRVKNSFNSYPVDAVAERAAIASLEDENYYRLHIGAIVATRDTAAEAFRKRGFQVLPSLANFLFVSPPDGRAAELYRNLSAKGVLVRYWSTPEIDRWVRITIGSDAEMQRLFEAIDAVSNDP